MGISHYFRQIDRIPLLTPEQEREFGWRVVNDGDTEAKEHMIRANLRLVVAIGRHYLHRGITLADVIAEGNVGLIRAVEGFDPAQGARFSTYASWWIKQSIKRALLGARQPVRIPAYMIDLITRCRSAARRLEVEFGRPPRAEEIARDTELSLQQVRSVLRAMTAYDSRTRGGGGGNGDAARFAEILEDRSGERPELGVGQREQLREVERLLEGMDERHAHVFRLRFGLDGREAMTLKQIGEEVGLTRERVRQIEAHVLSRLRRVLL